MNLEIFGTVPVRWPGSTEDPFPNSNSIYENRPPNSKKWGSRIFELILFRNCWFASNPIFGIGGRDLKSFVDLVAQHGHLWVLPDWLQKMAWCLFMSSHEGSTSLKFLFGRNLFSWCLSLSEVEVAAEQFAALARGAEGRWVGCVPSAKIWILSVLATTEFTPLRDLHEFAFHDGQGFHWCFVKLAQTTRPTASQKRTGVGVGCASRLLRCGRMINATMLGGKLELSHGLGFKAFYFLILRVHCMFVHN